MVQLRGLHTSLQFSDSTAQKKSDVDKIFARADERKIAWITGTESAENPLRTLVKEAAEEHGYTFHNFRGNTVCLRKALIVPESFKKGGKKVVDTSQVDGPGHDLGYVWSSFENAELGKITVIGSHFATRGRQGTKDPALTKNTKWNKVLAKAIGDFTKKQGRGSALVFYGGDQNDNDKFQDTFFGQPLTSAQDELKRYEKTHWGTIDVIASYDADGRVKASYVRALDDSEFRLNTDHHALEAGYEVRPL